MLATLAALLAAAAVAAAAILIVRGDGGDGGGGPAKAAATPVGSPWLDEAQLGAKVATDDPVRREKCFASGNADSCTLAQGEAGGADSVAPYDGVVTRWRVRHANGPITFRVLRHRGGRPVLVRSSKTVTPSGSGVNTFETCLPINRGDLIGISVARGGSYGVIWADSGSLYRWDSEEPSRDAPLESIAAVELLLSADVERRGACESS
jgi:hypothetical protein